MCLNHQLKVFLIPIRLTAAPSARGADIQNIFFWLGTTTFEFLNGELNDVMNIIKPLEKSGLSINCETIENEEKVQRVFKINCFDWVGPH